MPSQAWLWDAFSRQLAVWIQGAQGAMTAMTQDSLSASQGLQMCRLVQADPSCRAAHARSDECQWMSCHAISCRFFYCVILYGWILRITHSSILIDIKLYMCHDIHRIMSYRGSNRMVRFKHVENTSAMSSNHCRRTSPIERWNRRLSGPGAQELSLELSCHRRWLVDVDFSFGRKSFRHISTI